jgi:NodT family efflux transporter outer membrane factor (OMF) lipoprotein
MVGPKYKEPMPELSAEFTEQSDVKGPPIELKDWWTQFNDPTLNAMIEEAIVNNYDLRISLERIAEVRARYQFDTANLYPEIDLNASISRQRVSQALFDAPFFGPPVQNLFLFGFDASWELDFFGRLRSLQNASFFDLQASYESFRGVYITLIAELAKNYATFRALQQQIETTREQIRVSKEQLTMTEVRYQAGLQSDIEPLQAVAELEALQATLPPLEANLSETLYLIAVLLGRQPENIPAEWLFSQPIPVARGKIPVGLPSDLLRRRPDIREAERKLAAATSRVGATVAELFPTFSLTGSFGYQSEQWGSWFTKPAETWSIGPNLFWPFIDFGRIRSKVDLSKAAEREALLFYEKTVLEALQDVEDSLTAYSHEEKRLRELSLQIVNLKKSRDLTEAKYRAGLDSYSSLLNAEQQVLYAQQTLISSEQSLSEDLMAVYKSLGGDWSCCTTP